MKPGQIVSPPELILARTRTPAYYPSSNATSPPIHKASSLESNESDEFAAPPTSSSPPTSSPGVTATPPQDAQHTDHNHRIQALMVNPIEYSGKECIHIVEIPQESVFVKGNALDTRIYPGSLTLSPSRLGNPECTNEVDEDQDYSSGSASWIEDYIEPETKPPDTATVEFVTSLDAKLTRVLQQRSRIETLSPSEEISPYSRDLRARAAGLPATTFDETPPEVASQTSPCPVSGSGTPLESPTTQNCIKVKPLMTACTSYNKENAPSPPSAGSPVLFDTLSGSVDDQHLHTPDPEKLSIPPPAPRKALRQMRVTGPRERPPSFNLPSETLDLIVFRDLQSNSANVSLDGRSNDTTSEIPKEHTQFSGTKRSLSEYTDAVAPKKRKVTARKEFERNQYVASDVSESKDILAKLLNPGKFATRRASLRKAASLRSETSAIDDISPTTCIKAEPDAELSLRTPRLSLVQESHYFEHGDPIQMSMLYPSTQPATPIPKNARSQFKTRFKEQMRSPDSIPYPLPILAPPPYIEIPRAPKLEEVAEARLMRMLSQEQEERKHDGLLNATPLARPDSEQHFRENTFDCEMDELDDSSTDQNMQVSKAAHRSNMEQHRPNSSTVDVDEDENVFDWPFQHQICMEDEFRQEAVEWILDITPPEFRSKPSIGKHLREQLTTSPDTRWHAAQLFNRYVIRLGASSSSSPASPYGELAEGQKVTSSDERAGLVWDIALACLALSVKFHRDVLSPFFPVLSDEFLILASHDMEYDDLEAAQRDVFAGFSFCVGSVTPGAYIQELWEAVPSLKNLLSFVGGLEAAKRAAWEILYDSLFEISYLRFPTSLLTACAFVLGIIDTLVLKSKVDSVIPLQNRTARWRSRRGARCDCAQMRKAAEKKVQNIECDLREVLGLQTELWEECLHWLKVLLEGR